MTVSPWLTFEKLKELDASTTSLTDTAGQKPPNPSNQLTINEATGDDANDGFTAPVQTFSRLNEILRTYNWAAITPLRIDIDAPSGGILSGSSVTGLTQGRLDVQSTFTGNFTIENFRGCFWSAETFTSWTFDDCELSVFSCVGLAFQFGTLRFLNNTGGAALANFFDMDILVISQGSNGVYVENCATTSNWFVFSDVGQIFCGIGTTVGTNSTTGAIHSIQGSKPVIMNLDTNSPITTITGKQIDIFNTVAFANINIIDEPLGAKTTVASTLQPWTYIDGSPVRGTYADDTAAGAAGLVSGEIYQTATGELRIKL